MKIDKFFKPLAAFAIAVFYLVTTTHGQIIVETPKASKDKRTLDPECNLTDYEREYIFTKVEILATFKGFSEKWFEYAQKTFDFNSVIQNLPDSIQSLQDSIFVKFIVTKAGIICKIEILNGNKALADPVIKLLKMSPPWIPGISGGRYLNSYRTLKIEVLIDRLKSEFRFIRNFKSYSNPDG